MCDSGSTANRNYKTSFRKAKFVLFAFFLVPLKVVSADPKTSINNNQDNYFEYSLEELMQVRVEVPAAITKMTPADVPASITMITAEDIQLTPARNIYDLLEVYVPGAIWMNHEEGPHPGIRGNITNRNYKFLLLVNGRLMNSTAHYGAKSELEQWDMSDIERIEVIRGPGSVTYGPGAVAGVIKITTRDANTDKGNTLSARYVNNYDSKGISLRSGHQFENNNLYTFASVTRTNGYAAPHYLVTSDNEAGYVGEDILQDTEALDYYADYQDNPQVKLHIDLDFYKHWRTWLRYTQQGSTWRGNEAKSNFNGELVNQQSLRDRQLTAVAEYKNNLSKDLALKTMISVDSFDAERRIESVRNPDPDNVQNFKSNYSETELFLKGIFNWQTSDDLEIAFGAEFSRTKYGAGWGDSDQQMRLGDDANIVSGPDSEAISPNALDSEDAVYAGSGWYTSTFSLFGEANINVTEHNIFLVSVRADKNTFTDVLVSPRLAWISQLNKNNVVKVVAQRSKRMNTAGQLYIENINNIDSKSETLNSIEIAYNAIFSSNKNLKAAYFYNDSEVLSWNNTVDSTIFVGELKHQGIELEFEYKSNSGSLGTNYSYVKQTDWKLADDVNSSGTSYSDYNQDLRNTNATMTGVGNDLNNWPSQAFKIFGRIKITNKLVFHSDARILWDYQGSKDGLESLNQAVQGEPEEADVQNSLQAVEQQNVYEYDFRLNASVLYNASDAFAIQFSIQNLLGANDNKRYSYDTGMNRAAPHRVRYIEEPRTFGIRLDYKF